MTRLFILSIFLSANVCTYAQDCSIIKGTATQHATLPGNRPRKTLDENGKEIEVPVKKMATYLIYVETKQDCNLQITRIWISAKAYHATQEEIINKPVVIQPSQPGTSPDTLVRQTNNKVFRIQPTEEWLGKSGKKIINKQTRAKIIIEYVNKSRTAYFQIKEIKRIAPQVLQ